MKTLSEIIHARMEEIIQQVYFEIRSSGYANKLIGGIVITGGGSQMKHLKQLMEFETGLNARIGYPTEYLSKGTKDELKNPIYATGIGLIIKGFEELNEQEREFNRRKPKSVAEPVAELPVEELPQPTIVAEPEQELVEAEPAEQPVYQQPQDDHNKKKNSSWIKGLLTNVKDWFEDESVNNDFN